jgi:hypothetical protein
MTQLAAGENSVSQQGFVGAWGRFLAADLSFFDKILLASDPRPYHLSINPALGWGGVS